MVEALVKGYRAQISAAQLLLNPIDSRSRLGDGRDVLGVNNTRRGLTHEEEATNNEDDEATRHSDGDRA